MPNIFKRGDTVIDADIKRELIQDQESNTITLLDLYNFTQKAKEFIKYDEISKESRYDIEGFQDYILFMAKNLNTKKD